jgi:imidazolonepropionase-like amidohydrolase
MVHAVGNVPVREEGVSMTAKAIVNATVIDGTGRPPATDAVLLLDGDRVRAVEHASVVLPEGAEVIDAAGRFVVPGLMDANVHLMSLVPDFVLRYEDRYAELIEEAAQITLRAGVTTVFDTYGPLDALLEVRDGIERGERIGSRMFVAGQIIGYPGPLSWESLSRGNLLSQATVDRIERRFDQGRELALELAWRTPDGVGRAVGDYIERCGVDFIKYAACMHDVPLIVFSEPTQRAIVEAAHRAGLTAQAHTMSVESLRMEVEAGADLLTHPNVTGSEPIPDELLSVIVERRLPSSALIWTEKYRAYALENWSDRERVLFGEPVYENGRRMIEAGARMLLTTDGMIPGRRLLRPPADNGPVAAGPPDHPFELGESHFLWFVAAAEQGMAPMEALLSATRYVAEAYGKDAELGTLEPGKKADLLILDGDPLDDVHNYRRIAAVMKDGVVVDRDALPARRILT